MEVAEAQRTELWMNVGNSLGHDRLLAPWEGKKKKKLSGTVRLGAMLGGTEAELGQHLPRVGEEFHAQGR